MKTRKDKDRTLNLTLELCAFRYRTNLWRTRMLRHLHLLWWRPAVWKRPLANARTRPAIETEGKMCNNVAVITRLYLLLTWLKLWTLMRAEWPAGPAMQQPCWFLFFKKRENSSSEWATEQDPAEEWKASRRKSIRISGRCKINETRNESRQMPVSWVNRGKWEKPYRSSRRMECYVCLIILYWVRPAPGTALVSQRLFRTENSIKKMWKNWLTHCAV